jgi:hypothetical protein
MMAIMDGLGHFFVLLSTMTQHADTAHPVDYRLEVSPCARGDRARRDTAWLCGIARDGTWSYLLAYPISVHIARHGTGGDSQRPFASVGTPQGQD